MNIYDYHRRLLCQDVWSADELHLKRRVRSRIAQQLRTRFPHAAGVFLVGDLVGHYYHEGSALDLIVLVPTDNLERSRAEAKIVSGYLLPSTAHPVYFHILPCTTDPKVLADKFGTLFDLVAGQWVGKREQGLTEFTRPDAVLQYIRWQLYKAKDSDDPYPYEWAILPTVLPHFTDQQRYQLIESLAAILPLLKDNVLQVLQRYPDKEVWKRVDHLETLLEQDADIDDIDDFVLESQLPEDIVSAVYNRYRYIDVLDSVKEADERIKTQLGIVVDKKKNQLQIAGTRDVKESKIDSREAGLGASTYLEQKFITLVDRIIQRNGGYHNVMQSLVQLMRLMLERSRYVTSSAQRRKIATKLYREFRH